MKNLEDLHYITIDYIASFLHYLLIFKFAVDPTSSGVNDAYLHSHGAQNISYQALNSTSGGQTTQPYSSRNFYHSGTSTTVHRNDAQWKSLQNLHRTGNGNSLGQIHVSQLRYTYNVIST